MVGKTITLFGKKEDKGNKAEHKGLFTHEKAIEEAAPISQELESTINRLRVLEERYTNVQTELKVTEENMIHRKKKLTTDIKTLTLEVSELKKEIGEIKDKVLVIVKELQDGARKSDFAVLKKYVEMWEPMNFVTHKEVEEIIDEKLNKKR